MEEPSRMARAAGSRFMARAGPLRVVLTDGSRFEVTMEARPFADIAAPSCAVRAGTSPQYGMAFTDLLR